MRQKTETNKRGFFGMSVSASKNWSVGVAVASLFILGGRADNAYWSNSWSHRAAREGIEFEYAGLWGHFIGSITLSISIVLAGSLAWYFDKPRGRVVMSLLIWFPWLLASSLSISQGYYLLSNP
ncbi:MAG: hypothetical protein AAGJ38_08395 [Planctomycetota bacterium]